MHYQPAVVAFTAGCSVVGGTAAATAAAGLAAAALLETVLTGVGAAAVRFEFLLEGGGGGVSPFCRASLAASIDARCRSRVEPGSSIGAQNDKLTRIVAEC